MAGEVQYQRINLDVDVRFKSDGTLIPHAPLAQRTDQIDWNKIALKEYKADAQKCTGLLFKPGDKTIRIIEQ